jgi:hypothetical protein
MVEELKKEEFRRIFSTDPNPYISVPFIELNSWKVDRVVMLVDKDDKTSIGLTGGIRDRIFKAPFSAPFGGFHFRSETVHYSKIFHFLNDLKQYVRENDLQRIEIILPPDIYSQTFNAKAVNALVRNGYLMLPPDITSLGYLKEFKGQFSDRKYSYRSAERNGLIFKMAETLDEKETAFNLIRYNRAWLHRPFHMSFKEVTDVSHIWPVDYFIVTTPDCQAIASAILYRSHSRIVQAVWWGDNELGRSLKAMDFLCNKIWGHYKNLGYDYIEAGISTEDGIPNDGLLSFKERLDTISSLRFRFVWNST